MCGCGWSEWRASLSGMGVLASQSNPNLAKFGGGGQCRFCEAVCSDLVCDAGQSEIVTLSSRSVLKKLAALGSPPIVQGPEVTLVRLFRVFGKKRVATLGICVSGVDSVWPKLCMSVRNNAKK